MPDKTPSIDIDAPYRQEDYDFGPLYLGKGHKPTWTDGLPHEFEGWGPKTPDPTASTGERVVFEPPSDLNWAGESESQSHHVWHFDGRRRHNHH